MSKATESLLNGGYIAVANPANQVYPSPSLRRFRKALKAVVFISVVLCLAGVVVWHVLRPKPIEVYVSSATLTQFALTETNNLNYNLSLSLLFRNPNSKGHIKYKWMHASSYYHGESLGWIPIHSFERGCQSMVPVNTVFAGTKNMSIRGSQLEEIHREGFFDVDVKVYAWLKYKIKFFKTKHRMAKIKCELEGMVLEGKRTSENGGFEGTRCEVHM
ncbi:NDR1/HIN1-like protein 3 [Dioscorea cayenensis subsp. rotundata]|uniref:NDR1/HIN1-like protein 3 n=1 Tax=Dioscorea cayennensis subsp. rotundata TaxID=55577 RepID=A0AB40CGG1_DIOCR|nr:NDR1/HIN1-like protein 3 [Dioscorea cayenensis subsp. rotundata]